MLRPIEIAYRLRRWLFATLGVSTRGVKVMVFNQRGDILLIRQRYGATDSHVLPGGGIKRGETAADAAVREVAEEAACAIHAVVPFATYASSAEGRDDTIHVFVARSDDLPRPDGFEVGQAGFFPIATLPATVSDATRRRLAEYLAGRGRDANW